MLWRLQVPRATARFSARVCFRKTSVALQISGLGLIPAQILQAGRLGTDFNLSFWTSSCKKQPRIGKTQIKYIFFILPSKCYANEIYHWKAKLICYIVFQTIFLLFFFTYYICKAISECLAISRQLSTEGWSWDLYFLSRETIAYNWLII